ncbi:MAG: alpha/beta hydrolase [Pseudomonadota bacterium]
MNFSFCRRLPAVSRRASAIALLLAMLGGHAFAQTVLHNLPEQIGADSRYIIYVHGRIIETEGPEAVSERFGPYDFRGITEALSSHGHVVVAELREPGGLEYVDTIVDQVRTLRGAGVPSANITVVGFSKGGYMTLRAARELQDPEVNYAILAGCIAETIAGDQLSADGLDGRLLSMADSVDDLGFPCTPFFERNKQLSSPISIVFHEGTGHGLFYAADPVWLTPLMDWIDMPEGRVEAQH